MQTFDSRHYCKPLVLEEDPYLVSEDILRYMWFQQWGEVAGWIAITPVCQKLIRQILYVIPLLTANRRKVYNTGMISDVILV